MKWNDIDLQIHLQTRYWNAQILSLSPLADDRITANSVMRDSSGSLCKAPKLQICPRSSSEAFRGLIRVVKKAISSLVMLVGLYRCILCVFFVYSLCILCVFFVCCTHCITINCFMAKESRFNVDPTQHRMFLDHKMVLGVPLTPSLWFRDFKMDPHLMMAKQDSNGRPVQMIWGVPPFFSKPPYLNHIYHIYRIHI